MGAVKCRICGASLDPYALECHACGLGTSYQLNIILAQFFDFDSWETDSPDAIRKAVRDRMYASDDDFQLVDNLSFIWESIHRLEWRTFWCGDPIGPSSFLLAAKTPRDSGSDLTEIGLNEFLEQVSKLQDKEYQKA